MRSYLAGAVLFLSVTGASRASETGTRPELSFVRTIGSASAGPVATDPAGNIYLTGNIRTTDFPVKNALQPRLGGTAVRVTRDRGKTWSAPSIPSSVLAVAGSAKQPGVLFAGTMTGIYKSIDSGNNWIATSAPAEAFVDALVVDAADPALVYAGSEHGFLKSSDNGKTWRMVRQWDQSLTVLVSSAAQPATLYTALQTDYDVDESRVYRSTDRGESWTLLSSAPPGVQAMACDPSHPSVVYAATAREKVFVNELGIVNPSAVYKSLDAGATWTKLTELPITQSTFAIAANATMVYVGTQAGVYRSRDGGANWLPTALTEFSVNVSVDPNDSAVAYADSNGQIYASSDSGASWAMVLDVRQFAQTISVIPGSPSSVFIGAAPGWNIFVSKWSPNGDLLYSTFLGGSYIESASGIAVDAQGNAYVTGTTESTDFPTTVGVLQPRNTGTWKSFLAKLSPEGGQLLYGTYFGGSGVDAASDIAVDGAGNVYLTGVALSEDFPTTPGAFQTKLGDHCPDQVWKDAPWLYQGDVFVAKLNASASALSYATYLGGSGADEPRGIAVDASGNAHVVGVTRSPDFPVTAEALRPSLGTGVNQGFLTKLNAQGTGLLASTFIGGGPSDTANAVALDSSGNIYLTGSKSVDGGYLGEQDTVFVLKLNATATKDVFAKNVGGGSGAFLRLDPKGQVWLAGNAYSQQAWEAPSPFPSVHPFQADSGGGFVAMLSADGNELLFSSLMKSPSGLAVDNKGNCVLGANGGPPLFNAELLKIQGAVSSAVTLEGPHRLPVAGPFVPFCGAPSLGVAGVSSGEILTLNGSGLGPTVKASSKTGLDAALPFSLAGTTITFDGIAASLLSVQENEIVCIVPGPIDYEERPATTIQVQSSAGNSNSILLPTTPAQVEILGITNADGQLKAATAGSVMTMYAAGLGRVTTRPPNTSSPIQFVSILITPPFSYCGNNDRSIDAEILYYGPAPGQPRGINQINFRLPDGTLAGTNIVSLAAGYSSDSVLLNVVSR